MSRLFALAAGLLVVLLGQGWAVAPAAAAPAKVTFGLEPATAAGPDGRPDLAYSVTPGGVVFDHVAALNYSGQPLSLQLYATDAVETSSGGFGLLPRQATPTGVGEWISIPPQDATVRVPPATANGPGIVVVPITVHVPASATPGDHSGGVLVSLVTNAQPRDHQNVRLEQRVGTRVLMAVAGPVTPRLAVTGVQASYTGTLNPAGRGKVRLFFVVTNTGNVNLGARMSATVSGPLGAEHVRLDQVPLLLPGGSLHGSTVISDVFPQVLLHTTVSAQPHEVTPASAAALPKVAATVTTLAIPWTVVIIVVLLALTFFLLRRRRRSKKQPEVRTARAARPSDEPVGASA